MTAIHQNAMVAAEAVEAAGEQGKFWEMEEKITSNVALLSPAYLTQAATEIGLDMGRFNAAMADHRFLPRIQADQEEGKRLGIGATPTFIINGRMYQSAPSYEQLDAAVKEAKTRPQ